MRKDKNTRLILFLPALFLFLAGCYSIKPTYNKADISKAIVSVCQKEYGIEPKVWLEGETVWVYLYLSCLIDKDSEWDKTTLEKLNNVLLVTSRVVLSMNPRPQFMVLIASDTSQTGLDYYIINWIPDIVEYQLQLISRSEFGKRTVVTFMSNMDAFHDKQADHVERREITMAEFISRQIIQRIQIKLGEDQFKDYFNQTEVSCGLADSNIQIDIESKKTLSDFDAACKEILKIVAYVTKNYKFKDFLSVDISDNATGKKFSITRDKLRYYLK